jgi:hypothetical protein
MIRRNTIFSECCLKLVKVLLLEDSDVLLVLNVCTSGFKVAIMLLARDAKTVVSLVAVCVLSQIRGVKHAKQF